MAITDYPNGVYASPIYTTSSIDPLAGLNPPQSDPVPDGTTVIHIAADDMEPLIEKFREKVAELGAAAEEAEGQLRRVVRCFNCDEFAFDGTFTAYDTDEGSQPFCRECVRGIERRSNPAGVGDLGSGYYGGWWQGLDLTPPGSGDSIGLSYPYTLTVNDSAFPALANHSHV